MPELDVGLPTLDAVPMSFPVADAGVYNVRISSAELGTSQAGKKKLTIVMQPIEPVNCTQDDKQVQIAGRDLFRDNVPAQAGENGNPLPLMSLKKYVVACGFAPNGKLPSTEEFVGKVLRIKVQKAQNSEDGRYFNKVVEVMKA